LAEDKPKPVEGPGEQPIPKPDNLLDLNRFRSKKAAATANVTTLQTGLPVLKMPEAKDFVRVHKNEEEYWSSELCFVNVPVKGQKRETLHLIDEDVALRNLRAGKIQRFRLALATKPYDASFLCIIPSQNVDNSWNATVLMASQQAKALWIELTSRKDEGVDDYQVTLADHKDAFPEPKWPSRSLDELIIATFRDRMITTDDHPGLARLLGRKPPLS
jgi:hypothetical protein